MLFLEQDIIIVVEFLLFILVVVYFLFCGNGSALMFYYLFCGGTSKFKRKVCCTYVLGNSLIEALVVLNLTTSRLLDLLL